MHDADAIGEGQRLGHVVGHEDGGQRELLANAQERLLQPLAGDRIEGPEGFIQKHHTGLGGQGARHPDPLLLSPRQLAGPAVAQRGSELHEVEQLLHPFRDPFGRPAEQSRRHGHVLADRHVGKQADPLKDVPDPPSQLVRRQLGGVDAVEPHRAGRRLDQPVDHLEGRRLPGARAAEQDHQLAGPHAQAEVVDDDRVAVAFREAVGLDHHGAVGTRRRAVTVIRTVSGSSYDAPDRCTRKIEFHRLRATGTFDMVVRLTCARSEPSEPHRYTADNLRPALRACCRNRRVAVHSQRPLWDADANPGHGIPLPPCRPSDSVVHEHINTYTHKFCTFNSSIRRNLSMGVRWSLVVSDATDRSLRSYLARTGGRKGDLSRFVDRAVRQAIFWETLESIWERNRNLSAEEAQALADDAVAQARTDSP